MNHRMERFRRRLQEEGVKADSKVLEELEESAQRLVRLYLGKPKRLRPSAAARELKAMAKGLKRAAVAAERLGEQGMIHLFAASHASGEPDEWDPRPHIDYLERMARWADRAAEIAVELSESAEDYKGGRTPDENLRGLVVLLMDRFQELLGTRPTHSVNPETGVGESLFDWFAKVAITEFAPPGVIIEPRRIDDAIVWALGSRDLEHFTPPPLPDE